MDLSKREKLAVFICTIFLTATAFFYLFVIPVQENTERLYKMISSREKEVKEIKRLKEEYLVYQGRLASIENRIASIEKGGSVLTYLETIAQKSNVRDKITAITPQQKVEARKYKGTALEIKMENLSLSKIVDYLYNIENSEYWMKIDRLTLKTRYSAPDKFDVRFIVISFSLA